MSEELTTQIKAVTIFQSGARIIRVGQMDLDAGKHIILIKKMTRDLDKESVRVRGTGAGRIVNVNVERHSTIISKKVETDSLRDQVHELEKQAQYINEELQSLNETQREMTIFANNFFEKSALAYSASELEINQILQMETHLHDQDQQIRESRHEILNRAEENQKNLDQARLDLNNLGPVNQVEEYYDILINLESDEAGTFDLEVQFQIPNASWSPFYDVVLSENSARVKLLANVYNNSGEDWNDIDLEISSANLRPVRLIEPTPLIVREYVRELPRPRATAASRGFGMKKAMANLPSASGAGGPAYDRSVSADEEKEYDGAPSPPPPPPMLESLSASVEENVGVQSYHMPMPLSIPSDKNPHPVTLIETDLASTKGYFWSVGSPDQVLIKDTLTNEDILLLPGHAKVYYEGEFIGETDLPLISPKETLDVGTRLTYDLKVEKKLKYRQANKEGIVIKGKVTKRYEYEIKIKILKPSGAEIKVMDHIVHSDSEKIKVNLIQCDPEPVSKEMGVFTWKIPLENQTEIVLQYSYEVTYDKGIFITPPLP